MNGLHIQRMSQDEGDLVLPAQISQPVPGKQTLARHDEPFAIGLDHLEKASGITRQVDVFAVSPPSSTTQTCIVLACKSIPQ